MPAKGEEPKREERVSVRGESGEEREGEKRKEKGIRECP